MNLSEGLGRLRHRRSALAHSAFLKAAIRTAGVAMLLVGVQSWSFYHGIAQREAAARNSLQQLQQEVLDNRHIDASLQALRDLWQVSGNDARKRRILEVRDAVLQSFPRNARASIEHLDRFAVDFRTVSPAEQQAVDTFVRTRTRLRNVYADHYSSLVDAFASPPWYFQPAASLQPGRRDDLQTLSFNHALYLILAGDHAPANAILHELSESAPTSEFRSQVLYALARLQYDAYLLEADMQYFADSIQYARQSAITNPAYAPAKLLLEFLLGGQQPHEMDTPPVQGQGSGEGKAERGAIAKGAEKF